MVISDLKKIFFPAILILLWVVNGFAQSTSADTVAYKIGYYDVKAKQPVIEIAKKLKIEPALIVRLNRLRNVQQDLVKGQRIKIPVYAHGYKYEPGVPAKTTTTAKADNKTVVKKEPAESTRQAEPKKPQSKPAKKPAKPVEEAKPVQPDWQVQPNYDPELDENNLMLLDATLELNDAMLAGIKASLDTLSKPDPEIKNPNDVKEILARMKRQRDRKELIPYFEFMKDSLSLDNSKLSAQKENILTRLTPYYEHLKADSIQKVKEQQLAENSAGTQTKPSRKKEKEKPVVAKQDEETTASAKTKKDKSDDKEKLQNEKQQASLRDTIIIYDLGKSPKLKPAKEKGHPMANKASAIKPTDTVIAKEPAKQEEEAHEVVRVNEETATKQPIESKSAKHDDTEKVATKAKISPHDTVAVAKAKKQTPAKKAEPDVVVIRDEKSATAAAIEADKTRPIVDTVIIQDIKSTAEEDETEPKPTVAKAGEKKYTADTSPNYDTIQNIKSQFLVKRAQKAIADKKDKLAEEYLAKATDLWKDNYEAWMTMADMDLRNGAPVKALAEYQECVRIDSSRPNLFYKIASLFMQSKKKTEAFQYFTKTISVDPNYILAYMGRASIYSDWKQYDAAITDYNKVLSVNKKYHYAFKARGMVKQLNRNFADAVKDFTEYLAYEETDPSAYYYRGLAKIGNNELLEGCLDLSKSAEMGYESAEKAIKKSCE